eukprot:15459075-Alexandrium_andersonii.AAC.1
MCIRDRSSCSACSCGAVLDCGPLARARLRVLGRACERICICECACVRARSSVLVLCGHAHMHATTHEHTVGARVQ